MTRIICSLKRSILCKVSSQSNTRSAMGEEEALLAVAYTAAFLLVVAFLHKELKGRLSVRKLAIARSIPPGNSWLPVVGETLHFMRCYKANNVREFVDARRRKHGPVFRTSLFMAPTIVMDGAEANRFLYLNDGKLVRETYPSKSPGKLFGERSVVTQFGAHHKHLRRLLMSGLRPKCLKKFVSSLEGLTKKHFAQFWVGKDHIAAYSLLRSHSLSSTTNVLMGIEDEANQGEIGRLLHLFSLGLSAPPIYLPWTAFYKAFAAKTRMDKIVAKTISERKEQVLMLEAEGRESDDLNDILSLFIAAKDEDGNHFTNEEIEVAILTLLNGAIDVTSSVIAFTVKFMLQNPTCYEEVLKEQTAVAEEKVKNGEQGLGWEDLQKMKYTWATVQEAMRLLPQITVSFKTVMEDFEYEGYRIPRGFLVMHNISGCCDDENYFHNPKDFDPSRFVTGKAPMPYTYLPFGAGPHVCPGIDFGRMVILVYMHHLVRLFKLSLVDPMEPISMDPLPLPANGFPLRIELRSPI